jgi:NAD(P)-dependent dehydrogenase (short-subunit alcohol dehydrogenase family)
LSYVYKKAKEIEFMKNVKALMDMSGRRVLITGATGALGSLIADTMAELGADLFLVDRPESDFNELCDILSKHGSCQIDCLTCDLESQDKRDSLVKNVKDNSHTLDVLINNAAFVGASELEGWALPFEQQSVETWRRALEVNLTAAFDLSKQLAESMHATGNASIINVGSIYGVRGPNWGLYEGTNMANPAAYAASKGGLLQLTRWLATSCAPDVRVNCISPGGIYRNQPETFVERYESMTPLGRMATEEDFRGAFVYLASDLSKYVTGQNLIVDGGWTAW